MEKKGSMVAVFGYYSYLVVVFAILFIQTTSCTTKEIPAYEISFNSLIPKPVESNLKKECFTLNTETKITYSPESENMRQLAEQFATQLRPATGFQLEVIPATGEIKENAINLSLNLTDSSKGDELYLLEVSPKAIEVSAFAPTGIFRAIQTIRQLLPAAIEQSTPQQIQWQIASCTIRDYPRYEWRAAMLDVARHFFSVQDVKRYIDLLAIYKINKLHLHLTDDQGWRIEIKSWPKLTEIGGSTELGGGQGGFYTQDEFKDIVDYAGQRYIQIIPEIDLPGHITAAQASYAFLNCDNISPEPYTGNSVGISSICIQKETTYTFLDDVMRELAEISPSSYIHIGGDEALKTDSIDYVYFIGRLEPIVRKYNKIMIGWDEISNANLHETSIVQHWHKNFANITSQSGARIILSPSYAAYIDMKYTKNSRIGQTWAGLIEINRGYEWEPDTILKNIDPTRILGIEAPLWTETVETMKDIEYLAFPRIPGYAEIGWSPKEERNWSDYRKRLANHAARFVKLNVNYYKSPQVDWKTVTD